MKSFTLSASVEGAICGSLWWPTGRLAASHLCADLRGKFDRFARPDAGEHVTFRDALLSLLMEKGGDFQGAAFAAGTELVLTRREWNGVPAYQTERRVTKRIPLEKLAGCADLVHSEAHVLDFNL